MLGGTVLLDAREYGAIFCGDLEIIKVEGNTEGGTTNPCERLWARRSLKMLLQ